MLNVLGNVEAAETYVTENPSAHLHLYGKLEAKAQPQNGTCDCLVMYLNEVEEFGKGIDFRRTK